MIGRICVRKTRCFPDAFSSHEWLVFVTGSNTGRGLPSPRTSNDSSGENVRKGEPLKMNKVSKKLSTVLATGALALTGFGILAPSAMAAETPTQDSQSQTQSNSAGTLTQTSDATFLLKVNSGVKVDTKALTITQNGKTEKLPESGKDKNGQPVKIDYVKTKDGIEIRAIQEYADRSIGKCVLGTVGGAVGTGSAGFIGGGAVGTITVPVIGTVSGAAVGAIGGAIGGGASGAAASCFD